MEPMGMIALVAWAGLGWSGPPQTPREPVTDTYHGVEVVDEYRWLEDADDQRVPQWTAAQNAYTRSVLDAFAGMEALRRRLVEIESAETVEYDSPAFAGGQLFMLKRQPPKQQPFLVVMPSADQAVSARVVVDPNAIDPTGTTAIDWFVPSPDGRLVAVSLSRGGTERGDLHVFETSTGRRVDEVIEHVNGGTAGGDAAWAADGRGLFYTRYPRAGERPDEDRDFYQQVWFHRLGTPVEQDRYELGEDLPRIAEIQLESDARSGRVLATVQFGDSGQFAHYLRETDGSWRRLTNFGDGLVQITFGPGDWLYVISRDGAPRGKVLRVAVDDIDDSILSDATVFVPQGEHSLATSFWFAPSMIATDQVLVVTEQLGGPSRFRVFGHDGRERPRPQVLPVSSVRAPTAVADGQVLFFNTSFIDPPAWYRFDPDTGRTHRTALAADPPVTFDDVEVVREWAISRDGTRVPINILRPKGLELDGDNPVLLTGYGGYGISLEPRFRATAKVWLEQGGVYAVANLRGGGEFGAEWHEQGRLTNKQNVFDDFLACMQHMIDRGYTSPARLAIVGGSNGGLLMGAALTQRPDLCRAVVSFVGIYDMLRFELSPNGRFNVPEFGTVSDPEQFAAMYAYSPYHHVVDGEAYPAVLLVTGENDPRVDPMHSRKMTARLQAATGSGRPVLLRTRAGVGHGGDTALAERIEQSVDMYAFLFSQLGLTYQPVDAEPAAAGGGVVPAGP